MEEDKDKSLTAVSVSVANVFNKMPITNIYNISIADLSKFISLIGIRKFV
jgi:hypothetical protein